MGIPPRLVMIKLFFDTFFIVKVFTSVINLKNYLKYPPQYKKYYYSLDFNCWP